MHRSVELRQQIQHRIQRRVDVFVRVVVRVSAQLFQQQLIFGDTLDWLE